MVRFELVFSIGEVAGRKDIGDRDFKLMPDTMLEIGPLVLELMDMS